MMYTNGGVGVDSFVQVERGGKATYEVMGDQAHLRFGGLRSTGVTLALHRSTLEYLVSVATDAVRTMHKQERDSRIPTPVT